MFETIAGQPDSATVAYQAATLAARHAALWIAGAQVAVAAVVGMGQIAIVWVGIRAMQHMGERRAREQDQRHTESMATLADQRRALDDQRQALDDQRRALEVLIERTAPKGTGG